MSELEEEIVEYLRQKGVEEERIDKYRRGEKVELGEELERGIAQLAFEGGTFEEGSESHEEDFVLRLRHFGIEAEVVERPGGFWTRELFQSKTMVRLTGKNVDEIILQRGSTGPPGGSQSPGKIQLRVLFNKPLSRKARKGVEARTKTIKQNKKFGIFGGKVTDIKWVGNRIVDSLHQDVELRTKLVTAKEGFDHIAIGPEGKSAVNIEIVLDNISVSVRDTINMTDHFLDYDKIAKHVREVVDTY